MITRVWGTADSYDLTFTQVANTEKWQFNGLPIDTEDACYAVSIWAYDDVWGTGYWGGTLYINRGTYTLRMIPQNFILWQKQPPRLALVGRQKKGTAVREYVQ